MRATGIVLALVLGFLACTPTEPCACPPARTHAVVNGLLRTESSAPPDSALVRIEAARPADVPCDFTGFVEPLTFPHSGVLVRGGTFSMHVFSGFGPARRCLRVLAETPATVPLRGLIDGIELQLRHEREVPDTLRVLLVMRASNAP